MESETIRMALLGAIRSDVCTSIPGILLSCCSFNVHRYGKFAVIDLLDIENAWSAVGIKFEAVKKNLLSDLMSKDYIKDEKYDCVCVCSCMHAKMQHCIQVLVFGEAF